MAKYMASRIISGALDYSYVIERRPDLKSAIDKCLVEEDKEYLIVSE